MPRRLIFAIIGLVVIALSVAIIVYVNASLPDVSSLPSRVPIPTAMMRQRHAEAQAAGRRARDERQWVSYERISPLLRRAVMIAEDDAFFSHDGLDWNEIRHSVQRNFEAHRIVRGGSTITQQLARNLYLGDQRTITRKVSEALLARRIEDVLTKRRIFELYLNLIEWGDGIYGAEAAAHRYFGVSAGDLDARQAALLAAVIINPRRFDAAHPNRRIEQRAEMILGRMRRRGQISEDDYLVATGRRPRSMTAGWPDGAMGDSTIHAPATPDTLGRESEGDEPEATDSSSVEDPPN
jgi:monofunctional biosynthetic peptidoglycan transglycosylase